MHKGPAGQRRNVLVLELYVLEIDRPGFLGSK